MVLLINIDMGYSKICGSKHLSLILWAEDKFEICMVA